MRIPILTLSSLALAVAGARGASSQEVEFFEKRVRPVLADHCYKCHGPEKQKAELRLDSRAGVLKGTDVGPVVVVGKPEESSLIKSIRHEGDTKMPEKEEKLGDEQIQALTEWVKMGLPWPERDGGAQPSAIEEAAKHHWAFQPVRKPDVPAVTDAEKWAKSDLDRFILAKLEAGGLRPSPRADARTLIRRITFDLIGLPPTSAEVAAFGAESIRDPQSAIRDLIDRLLASPHYGERWGRHWLDVARYADTKGYVFQEERRFGFAYTYRDWVIKAFNDDLPYDQFLTQQIAGDHVAPPGDTRPLAALGFLTLGRRFLNNQQEIIDDRIDVVARGTMGLTVSCARCHDHKFDPVSQKDYYALYGIFASSVEPKELPLLPAEIDPANDAKYQAERGKLQADVDRFIGGKCLDFGFGAMLLTRVPVALPPLPREALREVISRADRDKARELANKIDALNAGPFAPPRAMALVDGPIVDPHVFKRGNPGTPGEAVPRRFVSVLSNGNPEPFKQGSGRLELAKAIASPTNPLTARVFVNRVWQYHFGKALVRTPSDFGTRGDPPTHPELLDWLASRFVEEGWSMKQLHRAIMLSATYQQMGDDRPQDGLVDPDNRLVWRMNRQRLDFEATRDALLCVAGQLDTSIGGRPVEITQQPFTRRRSIYSFIDRQNLPGVFRTFDFASPDTTNPQRFQTTVPQQALFLMNSPFIIEQAKALVTAAQFQQEQPYEEQVQELYGRVFARRAEPAEVDAALRYVTLQLTQPRDEAKKALSPWAKYAQVLLETNEFVFVD
ncbi:MAG TPA: PSD1 and planctomycete cytochrome C domain-containing protein [Chthoniobacteraceae bacterium]|jgi:mono/diheme cytochrome c family protein|nr:PSD1 and planctomycete cytochrome C domain-containing protein [Chthoniobacteraceae bacterium]